MANRDGVDRCVWCGESAHKNEPIIYDYAGEKYHKCCLDEQAKELAAEKTVCEGCDGSVKSPKNSDKRGLDRDNSELCLCDKCKEAALAAGGER